ncbi:hypothetical protein B5C26_00055, partial [Photorhabdus luminescens]|uniref:hypothetical protein n=1 Tax=Photorhabdus luminescens TaxID=29488 RepID=UPI000B718AE4
GFLAGKFGEAVFLTWRQAPSGERNFIKTKCRIKNQHFVNNLRPHFGVALFYGWNMPKTIKGQKGDGSKQRTSN